EQGPLARRRCGERVLPAAPGGGGARGVVQGVAGTAAGVAVRGEGPRLFWLTADTARCHARACRLTGDNLLSGQAYGQFACPPEAVGRAPRYPRPSSETYQQRSGSASHARPTSARRRRSLAAALPREGSHAPVAPVALARRVGHADPGTDSR